MLNSLLSRFVGRSFAIESPSGERYELPTERGGYVAGTFYDYYSRVSHDGQMWLCIAQAGTSVEPTTESAQAGLWLLEIAKGDKGEGWRYPLALYRWTDEANPAKPVGVAAIGWVTNPVGGRVVTDQAGRPLTDDKGQWIIAPHPKAYRLWGCTGIFDGATDEIIGDWGTPYPISGQDGEKGQDGQDGKDVDPETVDDLYSGIDRVAKGFGFNTAQELSAYLKLPMGKIFDYNATTGILTLSTLIAQRIATDQAFVNDLVIRKLTTLGGQVILDDTQAKFGLARINPASGAFEIYDPQTQKVLIQFGAETIQSAAEIAQMGGSQTIETPGADRTASGSTVLQNGITIPGTIATSVPLRVQTTIRAACASAPQAGENITTELYLRTDRGSAPSGRVAMVDWLRSYMGLPDHQKAVDRQVMVQPGRTYYLELVATIDTTTTTAQCSASWSTLSYDVAYSMDMIKYGANGLAFVPNSQNFFMVRKENGVLTTTIKGKTDMPGVLLKAHINAQGFQSKPWGNYKITGIEGSTSGGANKRLLHNVGHDQYSAICTPYGRGSVVEVIREDSDAVYIYATGAFNIELTGANQ